MRSYKDILRSTLWIGGSSVANLAIGIAKVKVLAVLIGPAGVGLMGLYQSTVTTTSTLVGLGVNDSGVRQLASASGDPELLNVVRRVLLGFNVAVGLTAAIAFWALRHVLATTLAEDPERSTEIGALGVAVFLTLFSGSQTALLRGTRRVRELALVGITGAVLGAIGGVASVMLWGEAGILPFVVLAPGATAVAAWLLGPAWEHRGHVGFAPARAQLVAMIRLGLPFMGAALLTAATQLTARTMILRNLDIQAAGHFQAAWAISSTYIGFVLTSMAADYFPRLSEAIADRDRAALLVNEQMEIALLFGSPVLIGMMGLAPWVIGLLYSSEFAPAVEVLRWQVLGDALKIVSWPLGFILIASARGGLFLTTQLLWNGTYLLLLWSGIDRIGLNITGIGFALAYLVVGSANVVLARRLIGFRFTRDNAGMALSLVSMCVLELVAAQVSGAVGLAVGLAALAASGAHSAWRLNRIYRWV